MKIVELTDLKTTINWLLDNGDFKDTETAYSIAMNSISIIEKQLALTGVVQAKPEKLQPKYCDQCGGLIKNEGHEYGCANTPSGNFEQF